MANELQAYTTTGLTLYAVLLNATGQIWNGAAFEAIVAGSWTSYDIALTEATAGIYLANMPAAVAGDYSYVVYERAGVNPAVTDTIRGSGTIAWDGSAEVPISILANATYGLSAIETLVDDLESRLTAARAGYLDNLSAGAVALEANVQTHAAAALTAYDPPTNAELEARTLPTASYFDPAADTVANVTTVGSVTTKTGYKLASDGLDSVSIVAPTGVASNFREMVIQTWRRFFKSATMTSTHIKTYADDGTTVITSQPITDNGISQVQGAAT